MSALTSVQQLPKGKPKKRDFSRGALHLGSIRQAALSVAKIGSAVAMPRRNSNGI